MLNQAGNDLITMLVLPWLLVVLFKELPPFQIGFIGADSMGAMGAIAPTAKKLWGRCPKVAPTNCTQPKGTVKITNVSL